MRIQNSFLHEHTGKLYVVPTPIGNLEDMTFRSIKILKKVDLIAAEDTRHTKKLLNHFDIQTPLISYFEHNKKMREQELVEKVRSGKQLALVSDAGMPAISDPGEDLIKAMIENDLDVVVLPGANAALCALVGSSLQTDRFLFYGFLPRKNKERSTALKRLAQFEETIIFYESPYRIQQTLESIQAVFGEHIKITLARELTKKYEQYVRTNVKKAIQWAKETKVRGEFVIVVEGLGLKEEENTWDHLTKKEHVKQWIEKGYSRKDAIQKVSELRKISRRKVYQAFHKGE